MAVASSVVDAAVDALGPRHAVASRLAGLADALRPAIEGELLPGLLAKAPVRTAHTLGGSSSFLVDVDWSRTPAMTLSTDDGGVVVEMAENGDVRISAAAHPLLDRAAAQPLMVSVVSEAGPAVAAAPLELDADGRTFVATIPDAELPIPISDTDTIDVHSADALGGPAVGAHALLRGGWRQTIRVLCEARMDTARALLGQRPNLAASSDLRTASATLQDAGATEEAARLREWSAAVVSDWVASGTFTGAGSPFLGETVLLNRVT